MKINSTDDNVIERDGLGSDGAFTIQFNAKMAKILSDGLYSNKVQSIIRELSCNAIDSHVESGQADRPIEVHLPTIFEPFFHVRDFGIGLDHQQVINIFTCYGASTKTNSNAFIGQLGLGSKSPFSYVDAFDVSARKDGIERQYSMYKDEKGMPSVALLGEKSTTEGNGVTVKMPVKQDDIRRFSQEARNVFTWFSVIPTVTGVSDFEIKQPEIAYQGNSWKIRKKTRGYYSSDYGSDSPVALMGRVAYRLDPNSITNLSKAQRALFGMPLVLEFGIGDLEIAASREALGYDTRTQDNIRKKLDIVLKELAADFEQRMASAKTEWEARQLFGSIFGNESGFRWELEQVFEVKGLNWRGKAISDSSISLNTEDLWPLPTHGKPKLGHFSSGYKRIRVQSYHTKLRIGCNDDNVIMYDDLAIGGQSRAGYWNETNGGRTVWLFQQPADKTWDELSDMLGNPTVIFTSTLPKRPVAERSKVSMRVYNPATHEDGPKAWEAAEVVLEDGGFYVMLDTWDVKDGERWVSNLNEIVKQARTLKILDNGAEVYAPRGHFRDKVKNNPEWINLFDHIREKLSSRITPLVLQTTADIQELELLKSKLQDMALITTVWKLKKLDGVMGRWLDSVGKLMDSAEKGKNNLTLINLAKTFGHTIPTVTSSVNAVDLYTKVMFTYPMLHLYLDGYGRRISSHVAKITDYINMVDEFNEKNINAAALEVVAA